MSEQGNVKLMNKWSMLAMNIGSMIGAGIVTLVGIAMGYTGTSVWFAYGIALLLGFLYNLPFCFVTSAVKLEGGPYTLVNTILGKKIGGIYIVCFFLYLPSIALYCVALNTYIQSLFEGVPDWLTPVATLIFFYVVQLRGIKSLASVQNVMTILLLIGLMMFALMGFSRVEWAAVSPSSPDFMTNGFSGVMKAALLLVFSTYGQYYIAFMSRMCEDPKHDIPFSIIGCVLVLVVVYISVSIVAAGVLPLDVVANQPLTYVAREILPAPLFAFFIIARKRNPAGSALRILHHSRPYHGAIHHDERYHDPVLRASLHSSPEQLLPAVARQTQQIRAAVDRLHTGLPLFLYTDRPRMGDKYDRTPSAHRRHRPQHIDDDFDMAGAEALSEGVEEQVLP